MFYWSVSHRDMIPYLQVALDIQRHSGGDIKIESIYDTIPPGGTGYSKTQWGRHRNRVFILYRAWEKIRFILPSDNLYFSVLRALCTTLDFPVSWSLFVYIDSGN